MKNRIGFLLVAAGISVGAATLTLSAPASADECDVAAVQNACAVVDIASCVVAVASTCTDSECVAAVASNCDDCVVGVLSDCAPEPTPTATPSAVAKILQLIES